MTGRAPSLVKTTPPSLPVVLPRERLFALLDHGRQSSLTWVSGPPGAGKTTLVSSYLDARGISCLWYQVDQADGDIATFFYYMGQTAPHREVAARSRLPRWSSEYLGDLSAFARRYFRTLFERMEAPFAVVLDSYQEVPPQSSFHEVVRDLFAEIPKDCCAIVISRADPPPAMARLRANRTLEVLGWNELRLTREESDGIVRMRGRDLPEEGLARLYHKTQGWPAGLVLMLEHVPTEGWPTELPAVSTPQVVFDYLAGEIFQRANRKVHDFALRTACLPQMTAAMARELSGQSQAAQILEELTRTYSFVTARQAGAELVYEYHPLLREFLLARARESLSEESYVELYRKAAALLEANGRVEDAVAVWIEVEEWDALNRIIREHAVAMLDAGRGETLVQWLENLPAEMLRADPWMLYWLGACRFPYAPRESRRLYERAFELFKASGESHAKGLLLACSGVMDAILYELDDLALLDRWIPELTGLVKRYPDSVSGNVEARVTSSLFMSLVLRQPNHSDIEYWVDRAITVSRSIFDPSLRMQVELLVAISFMWTGRFERALEVIERMRELGQSPEVSPLALITLRNVESMYYMLIGLREPCLEAVYDGLGIARTSGVHIWSGQLLANGVAGALGGGDLEIAERLLGQLEGEREGTRRLDRCLYHYFSAWHAMLRKDLVRAYQHQKKALRLANEVGVPFFEVLARLGFAQVLFQCGDERKGAAHLQQVHSIAREIKNRWLEFMSLLAYAQIALEHGRKRSGLNSLRYAMGLGREYGYTHFLWWQPEVMGRLCAHALEAGIEPDYVKDLIRKRGLAPGSAAQHIDAWPWRFKVFTLGRFTLLREDEPCATPRKSQGRPVELLKTLIAFGGREVSVDRLADALWPRVDSDYAHRSFTTTLHRLRKLIGADEVLVLQDGCLSLAARHCWVDTWALEQALGEIDHLLRGPDDRVAEGAVTMLAERVMALYRGPFLASELEHPAYMGYRDKLRSRLLRCLGEVGRYWEKRGRWDTALEYYQRGLEVDGVAEGLYRHLMVCYQRLGRLAEGIEVYNRCRKTLAAVLDISPSRETTAIYDALVQRQS
jgi:LuxR family maltose regulon positive regulatory protein